MAGTFARNASDSQGIHAGETSCRRDGDDASTLTGDGSTGRLDTVRERSARAIVRALREYGAIVVDRADAPTLYAQSNVDYGRLLYGNELGELRLTDFDPLGNDTQSNPPNAQLRQPANSRRCKRRPVVTPHPRRQSVGTKDLCLLLFHRCSAIVR